jgi:ribonuclease BN (tRNA processing enzyme)
MTEAVLLGSGGWIPTSMRATCSALRRRGDHALVMDAGTGISRLVERPDLLDGVQTLDVVLTHFHLDHVVGLAYLPALPLPHPPRIYGPGQRLHGRSTREILERLIGPPLFAVELEAFVSEVGEIDESGLELGPFDIAARIQSHHNDPTLAFRLDGLVTCCTDTSYDGGNVAFAQGSRVLMHEAWYTEDAPREESTHSSAREAAEIARRAAVERLVLIHIRPGGDEEALLEEARSVFENSVLGSDLLALE